MKLTSPEFKNRGKIPSKLTCDGKGISPELNIEEVPQDTKSLVLIMDDPDAPMGTWDHWIVFNMPANIRKIEEGKEPIGVGGKNSWNKLGYGGPCPPDREHRYFFKIFALNTRLDLKQGANKLEVIKSMNGYILATATLMGRYERQYLGKGI